jgi:hypothetical protein
MYTKKNKKPLMTYIYNNGRLEDLYDKNSLMYLLIWSGDLDTKGSIIDNRSLTLVKDKGIYSINYVHVFSKCNFTQCNICKEYNKDYYV